MVTVKPINVSHSSFSLSTCTHKHNFPLVLITSFHTRSRHILPHPASCDQGNEPSGSIKGREFLDQLNDCQLLKTDSAACMQL
jgi:hypothetical protein